jgi:hypothetical protein
MLYYDTLKINHMSLQLNKKIERSAMELSKLNAAWKPAGQDIDLEIMTDEERECFRKMGLKMRSCLVLGNAFSSLEFHLDSIHLSV